MSENLEITEDDPRSPEWDDNAVVPGYKVRKVGNVRVIELDLEADPAKRDPDGTATTFLNEMRGMYRDENKLRREFLRDHSAGGGDVFFPEFILNGGRARYCVQIPKAMTTHEARRPKVMRGWDFGVRHPICIFAQKDPNRRRIMVLRTVAPGYCPIHNMRDLVRYISGEAPLSILNGEDRIYARNALTRLEKISRYPLPWFGPGEVDFTDYGGAEMLNQNDFVERADLPRSRREVLEEAGIFPQQIFAAKSRDTIARELLGIQEDGWPGLVIDPDPSNEELLNALGGGLSWARESSTGELSDTYAKDGTNDHVYEALFYAVVGVMPVQHFAQKEAPVVIQDRRPKVQTGGDGLGFVEGRVDLWK